MIQPALIVVNRNNEIQQKWSWKTPPLNDLEPKDDTKVPGLGGMVMVGVRPDSSDLGPSIDQNRNVRLHGRSIGTIGKESETSSEHPFHKAWLIANGFDI